jgi:hypothetical protein
MRHAFYGLLAAAFLPACAFAVDGVVLINQSTVTSAGGFPYTISQPGSYKLSGNLSVPANIDGILITASNVTLDLNGFSIVCAQTTVIEAPPTVITIGAVTGVTIRNGTISSGGGFPLNTLSAAGVVAEDLTIIGPPGGGGDVALGPSAVVRRVLFPTGTIGLSCQTLVVDSVAAIFVRSTPSGSCVYTFGFVVGQII